MKKLFSVFLTFIFVFAAAGCADLDPITGDLSGVQDSVSNLEATISALQSEIDALETALEDLDGVQDRLTELETTLDGLPTYGLDLGTLTMTTGDLSEDLTLPTLSNAEVIWVSSDSTVLTSDGTVIRPNLQRGDVEVTLTAIVLDGNLAAKKAFVFTVLAEASDDELILDFVNNLPDEIDDNIDLPSTFGDIIVEWSSTDSSIIATNGMVNRPHLEDGDAEVTLSTSMVLDGFVREFRKTVTVLKEPVAISGALGNPFVATLTTDEGHMLHIPVENIDNPEFNSANRYALLYTPEFGAHIPSNVNGWGLAMEIKADGELVAIYDGISGVKRLPDGTTESWKAGDHYAKDPASCDVPADGDPVDWSTCDGLAIPEDGYIILFHNTGGPNRHNREFARSYVNSSDRTFTIEGVTLTPSTMHFEVTGGVWWRGNATVSIPKAFINPNVQTFDYKSVVVLDENDMQVAGAPVIFTQSYIYTTGVGLSLDPNNFDINNGWGIAAEITPELRDIQVIGDEEDPIEWQLTNEWTITRVYDGIGGGIKNPLPIGTVPISGGDYGKNIRLPDVGYVMVFPNASYGYGSDADVFNRRIGADFFYHLDNWIFAPTLTEETELIAPERVLPWPFE